MPIRRHMITTVVAVALVGGACSGERPVLGDPAPTTSAGAAIGDSTDDGATVDDEKYAAELETAVEDLIAAGSYRFAAEVSLRVGDEETGLQLSGWVDEMDRELVMQTGATSTITRVLDGVATVERGNQVTEVPLERASSTPTLEILTKVEDVTAAPGGTLKGRLSSAALTDLGFVVEGSARVAVVIVGGMLTRYVITADDQAWSITSDFTDVGSVSR